MNSFVSCEKLEYGLEFLSNTLRVCCEGENTGGGRPYLISRNDYYGELLDWEEIFRKKWLMRDIQRSGNTNRECLDCRFLENKKWSNENKIKYLIINHFFQCNCGCTYCYREDNKKSYDTWKPFNVYLVIKDMINKNILAKNAIINFGGGEPTMLEEFEDLVNLFIENNVKLMDLYTSGIKYSEKIEEAIKLNKMNITISLDSYDSLTYYMIKKVNKFDIVIENIKKYVAAQKNNNVKIKYIIVPKINDNLFTVRKWVELCKSLGVKEIILDLEANYYINNKYNIPQHIYDIEKMVSEEAKKLNLIYKPYNRLALTKRK